MREGERGRRGRREEEKQERMSRESELRHWPLSERLTTSFGGSNDPKRSETQGRKRDLQQEKGKSKSERFE